MARLQEGVHLGVTVAVWLPFHVPLCCGVRAGLWSPRLGFEGGGLGMSAACVPWYVRVPTQPCLNMATASPHFC